MMGTERRGITKNIVMHRLDHTGSFIGNVEYS